MKSVKAEALMYHVQGQVCSLWVRLGVICKRLRGLIETESSLSLGP